MRQRYFLHVLWAVMIVATQFAAVIHSTQHELAAPQVAHCDLCAVAHAPPVPPVAVVAPDLARFSVPAPVMAPAGVADRRPYLRPNSRAPPASRLA